MLLQDICCTVYLFATRAQFRSDLLDGLRATACRLVGSSSGWTWSGRRVHINNFPENHSADDPPPEVFSSSKHSRGRGKSRWFIAALRLIDHDYMQAANQQSPPPGEPPFGRAMALCTKSQSTISPWFNGSIKSAKRLNCCCSTLKD